MTDLRKVLQEWKDSCRVTAQDRVAGSLPLRGEGTRSSSLQTRLATQAMVRSDIETQCLSPRPRLPAASKLTSAGSVVDLELGLQHCWSLLGE